MQDALSRAVTASLNLRVPTPAPAPARDVRAFECYARGRRLWERLEKGSFDQARELYERAIAADAGYAPALSGLAALHAMRFTFTTDPGELELASDYARRAIAADPRLADPYIWLGYALMRQGRMDEAKAAERTAQQIDQGSTYAIYFEACVEQFRGRPAEAIPLFQRVIQREPHGFAWLGLASAHCGHGNLAEAAWCAEQATALERGNAVGPTAGASCYLAECLRLQGRLDEARTACLAGLDAVERTDHMLRDSFRGVGLLTLGRIALDQEDLPAARAAFTQLVAHVRGRHRTLGGGFLMVQGLAGLSRAGEGPAHLDEARRLCASRDRFDFALIWLGTEDAALLELARAAQLAGDGDAGELLIRARDAGSYEARLLLERAV